MKKIMSFLLLASLVVMAASCEDDLAMVDRPDETGLKMVTEIVTAKVNDDTKVTYDNNGTFAWSVNDHIAVHVSNGNNHKYVFTSAQGASGASVAAASASFTIVYPEGYARDAFAIFPSTIVEENAQNYGQTGATLDVNLPNSYELSKVSGNATPCPMIATNQSGSGWSFKQLCGVLRLTVSGIPSGTSYLKVDFNGRQVSGPFSIEAGVSPGSSSIGSVSCEKGINDFILITGIGNNTSVTVNLPLPTGAPYSDLIVSAWNSSDVALRGQVTPFSYVAAIKKGKKLEVTLNRWVFSVAEGKYALFAPGNLQAVFPAAGSACTWSFVEPQYHIRGGNASSINGSGTVSKATTVELFGWNGESSPEDNYGIHKIVVNANYGNVAGENLKHDWGELPIGEYSPGTWSTPTLDQWKYILNERTTTTTGLTGTDNIRYAKAQIDLEERMNDLPWIHGVIIFPDIYVHPSSIYIVDNKRYNSTSAEFDSLVADEDADWSKMEAAGAVFLPSAGYRGNNGVGHCANVLASSSNAYYWSSTSLTSSTDRSYAISFENTLGYIPRNVYRYTGCSVRLIRELN